MASSRYSSRTLSLAVLRDTGIRAQRLTGAPAQGQYCYENERGDVEFYSGYVRCTVAVADVHDQMGGLENSLGLTLQEKTDIIDTIGSWARRHAEIMLRQVPELPAGDNGSGDTDLLVEMAHSGSPMVVQNSQEPIRPRDEHFAARQVICTHAIDTGIPIMAPIRGLDVEESVEIPDDGEPAPTPDPHESRETLILPEPVTYGRRRVVRRQRDAEPPESQPPEGEVR